MSQKTCANYLAFDPGSSRFQEVTWLWTIAKGADANCDIQEIIFPVVMFSRK